MRGAHRDSARIPLSPSPISQAASTTCKMGRFHFRTPAPVFGPDAKGHMSPQHLASGALGHLAPGRRFRRRPDAVITKRVSEVIQTAGARMIEERLALLVPQVQVRTVGHEKL